MPGFSPLDPLPGHINFDVSTRPHTRTHPHLNWSVQMCECMSARHVVGIPVRHWIMALGCKAIDSNDQSAGWPAVMVAAV